MRMHDKRPWAYTGFTLVELLVVISIIALLAAIVLPIITHALGRGRAILCQSNLKQAMTGLLSSSIDNEGMVYLFSYADDENMSWAARIYVTHLNQDTAPFHCPAYPPGRFDPQFRWMTTFGIREDPPPQYVHQPDFDTSYLFTESVERPIDFLLVADTTSNGRSGLRARQYRTFNVSMNGEVHARHNNTANGAFMDGHVEAMPRERLEALGIEALYGRDEAPGYF
jgi:prepilin-type N-terminal cleavage/methylation domain-containing protein/prepilin-type processing-associated H-X9-DG protein